MSVIVPAGEYNYVCNGFRRSPCPRKTKLTALVEQEYKSMSGPYFLYEMCDFCKDLNNKIDSQTYETKKDRRMEYKKFVQTSLYWLEKCPRNKYPRKYCKICKFGHSLLGMSRCDVFDWIGGWIKEDYPEKR